MKNIILLVVLVFCIPSQASVVGSLFKVIKKGADEAPTSAKKSDSETINEKKEDAVPKDIDKDLADDLAFIESPNFRFSPDDLLKGGDDLDNAFSLIPPSQEFINFSNWLKIQMVATPLRTTVQDFIDQSNKELIDSDDESLTVEQLHELISQELKETSDVELYGVNLATYFSRLAAYGWSGFHPLRDYDASKLSGASFETRFIVETQTLSLMKAAGFDVATREKWVRKTLSGWSKTFNRHDLLAYLSGCIVLPNDSPNMYGAMFPVTEKIVEELCSKEDMFSVVRTTLPFWDDSRSYQFRVEGTLLVGLSQAKNTANYYPNRDKLLSRVPDLLVSEEDAGLAADILRFVAYGEIGFGNLENAYDISLLLLYEFGQDPEIRNWVLGYLMPAIFIEARDLVMTGKLLRMVEPMVDVQSDFFIAAESKINLLTVMINYKRLIKEQTI